MIDVDDCPPIAIVIATATLLTRLQASDTFAMRFGCRWSFADFAASLENAPNNRPWVDVVPPVHATSDMDGRYWYLHGVPVRIGVRAKMKDVAVDWSEAMDPDKIRPFVNLLYEIKGYFDPSTVNPRGLVLEDYTPGAQIAGACKIIKVWDPELLTEFRVYEGIIEVPFKLKVQR